MFKKLLASLVLFAAGTSAAFANTAPYVGATFGINTNTATAKSTSTSVLFGSYRGMPLSVFAGYGGLVRDSLYIAGEVTGILGSFTIDDPGRLRSTYGYAFSVIPGLMLSDHTIAYLRAGVIWRKFPNLDDSSTGGQFGAGLQTNLTQNVDLRGEYQFAAFSSMSYTESGTKYNAAPRSDSFLVSLVYKFD